MNVTVRLEDLRSWVLYTSRKLDEADLRDTHIAFRGPELRRSTAEIRSAQYRLHITRLRHGRKRDTRCRYVQSWSTDHCPLQLAASKSARIQRKHVVLQASFLVIFISAKQEQQLHELAALTARSNERSAGPTDHTTASTTLGCKRVPASRVL